MTTTLRTFASTIDVIAVLALAAAGAGCIEKDSRSVIYLDPDGSLTWTVLETDVRSNSEKPDERAQEEAEYRRTMLSNPTPLVALFESLGGRSVSRTVLKDTVPFEVHTSARFDRIDSVFERMCAAATYSCLAHTEIDGGRTTLVVEMLGELDGPGPDQGGVLDALEELKFVLIEGRFVAASGFVLDGTRTAKIDDKAGDGDEPVTLTLTWEK